MDSNKMRVEQHRAQIAANISGSTVGEVVQKSETISIAEFQNRLEKGEKFLTPADVEKFQSEIKDKVVKAFNPKDKESILKKGEAELNLLKGITVENEIGRKFNFFSIGKEESEGE